jgi:hypothetical protein
MRGGIKLPASSGARPSSHRSRGATQDSLVVPLPPPPPVPRGEGEDRGPRRSHRNSRPRPGPAAGDDQTPPRYDASLSTRSCFIPKLEHILALARRRVRGVVSLEVRGRPSWWAIRWCWWDLGPVRVARIIG